MRNALLRLANVELRSCLVDPAFGRRMCIKFSRKWRNTRSV
jgi:hypothetical protein